MPAGRSTSMMDLMRNLDFPRVAGTDGEHRAARVLIEQAQALMVDVSAEAFPVKVSSVTRCRLQMVSSSAACFKCTPLVMAGSTPEGGIEAPVVYIGTGAPREVERARGAIALMYDSPKASTWENLKKAGVVGLICVTHAAKGVTYYSVDPGWIEKHGSIPGVTVSLEDGMEIARMASPRARLEVKEEVTTSESCNVIATIPGSGNQKDEIIYVAAHYDSVRDSTGAHDDLAGTAVLWELMRHFASLKPNRTLKFVAFGSEEEGVIGSLHHVRQNRDALSSAKILVNIDVGGGVIGRDTVAVNAPDEAMSYIEQYNAENGLGWDVIPRIYGGDNAPFAIAGIPSITFYRTGGSAFYIHTERDSLDWIGEEYLERWYDMVCPLLKRWADAYEFPFEATVKDSTRKDAKKLIADFSALDEEQLEDLRLKKNRSGGAGA